MTDDKIKLPRSSYEELAKIIKAYGRLNKPSTLNEVNDIVGIGATNVSANHAFLVGIGVIEGIKTKSPTDKGFQLARALEHDMANEILQAWRRIVEENDFLNKMVQAVSVRKGMEVAHLSNHIAYSAGESKASYVLTGARTVIDILLASGFVKEDGGRIVPNSSVDLSLDDIQTPERTVTEAKPPSTSQHISIVSGPMKSGVTLHIEVRINVTPSELDGLGEKLKGLIESISKSEDSPHNRPEND